jgi:sugar phosphate isomerase/epimerase
VDCSIAESLRRYAGEHGLFVEGSTSLPDGPEDLQRFGTHLRRASEMGARVVRIAMGGRRYEQFERFEGFEAFASRSLESLRLAEPLAARYGVCLALENHKDFRVDGMLGILERMASAHLGVCVDTGNSIALLEDPLDAVRAYAPWARSVHLKDMAVCEHEDGFLLAEVPLGEGSLDLRAMAETLREARPEARFTLEMPTRDPLRVPCLTDRYWRVMRDVPGRDLARTLRWIRAAESSTGPLPEVGRRPIEEQVRLEEQAIRKCLVYASKHLDLGLP